MVRPYTPGAPGNGGDTMFPAYRESSNKLYVPHYYGRRMRHGFPQRRSRCRWRHHGKLLGSRETFAREGPHHAANPWCLRGCPLATRCSCSRRCSCSIWEKLGGAWGLVRGTRRCASRAMYSASNGATAKDVTTD